MGLARIFHYTATFIESLYQTNQNATHTRYEFITIRGIRSPETTVTLMKTVYGTIKNTYLFIRVVP